MNAIQRLKVLNGLNLERLNRAPAFNDMNAAARWNGWNVWNDWNRGWWMQGAAKWNVWNIWNGPLSSDVLNGAYGWNDWNFNADSGSNESRLSTATGAS